MSGLAIAFVPSMISNGTFATRRANTGLESMETNPYVGVLNMNLAGGQIVNMTKAVSNIAKESNSAVATTFKSAEESIKEMAKTDRVLSGSKKVFSLIADNINKFIVFIAGVKVLFAKDKKEAVIEEGVPLATMFAGEYLGKQIIGLPKINNVAGKDIIIEREALYKRNPFLKKQAEAIKDYCATKKALNFVPGALKGGMFAFLFSIGGYKLGRAIVNGYKEEKECKQSA